MKIVDRIKNNNFIKSVFALASGSVIAQAINFFGMPIIGRIYSPSSMGDYTLVTANAGTIMAIACLGMMTSIMIPKEDEEAKGLVKLICVASIIITALIVGILRLVQPYYQFFHAEDISYSVGLAVLGVYVISNVVSSVCYGYVNRQKKYGAMFWNPIIGGGVNVILGIAFGIWGYGFVGYTLAHIISLLVSTVYSIAVANPFSIGIHSKIWTLLKQYRKFPIYMMPANLIQNLSAQIPVQLMEELYSSYAIGMYSMALRILSIPSTILAVPINRVYYQEANERYNKGEKIGDFSFKILETNIKIAIIPILILIVFGRFIFSVFLGNEWGEAGEYASIIGIYQLMLFCAGCLSGNFVIIRKNHWNLIVSIASLVLEIVLSVVFGIFLSASFKIYIITLCIVLTIHLIVAEGIFLIYTGLPIKKYFLFICKYIIIPSLISLFINVFIH